MRHGLPLSLAPPDRAFSRSGCDSDRCSAPLVPRATRSANYARVRSISDFRSTPSSFRSGVPPSRGRCCSSPSWVERVISWSAPSATPAIWSRSLMASTLRRDRCRAALQLPSVDGAGLGPSSIESACHGRVWPGYRLRRRIRLQAWARALRHPPRDGNEQRLSPERGIIPSPASFMTAPTGPGAVARRFEVRKTDAGRQREPKKSIFAVCEEALAHRLILDIIGDRGRILPGADPVGAV